MYIVIFLRFNFHDCSFEDVCFCLFLLQHSLKKLCCSKNKQKILKNITDNWKSSSCNTLIEDLLRFMVRTGHLCRNKIFKLINSKHWHQLVTHHPMQIIDFPLWLKYLIQFWYMHIALRILIEGNYILALCFGTSNQAWASKIILSTLQLWFLNISFSMQHSISKYINFGQKQYISLEPTLHYVFFLFQ